MKNKTQQSKIPFEQLFTQMLKQGFMPAQVSAEPAVAVEPVAEKTPKTAKKKPVARKQPTAEQLEKLNAAREAYFKKMGYGKYKKNKLAAKNKNKAA
jgi:hypothetical protein